MRINKELIKGSTALMILSLLEKEDLYGYEIIKKLEVSSSGIFSFKEGTLYPILHALESKGYVEGYWLDSDSGRKRKYYHITNEGLLQLSEKRKEWSLFKGSLDKILGGTQECSLKITI